MSALADQIRAALKQARVDAGLSIPELAAMVPCSTMTVSAIEAGRRDPTLAMLSGLLDALGLGVHIGPAKSDDLARRIADARAAAVKADGQAARRWQVVGALRALDGAS